jgi:hypothetical protein
MRIIDVPVKVRVIPRVGPPVSVMVCERRPHTDDQWESGNDGQQFLEHL